MNPIDPTDEKRPGSDPCSTAGIQHMLAAFSEQRRLGLIKDLGYLRMRARGSRVTPLVDWEVENLCDALESTEEFFLQIWPVMIRLLEAMADQPYLDHQ